MSGSPRGTEVTQRTSRGGDGRGSLGGGGGRDCGSVGSGVTDVKGGEVKGGEVNRENGCKNATSAHYGRLLIKS